MKAIFVEKRLPEYLEMFGLVMWKFFRDRLLLAAGLGGAMCLLALTFGGSTFYVLALIGAVIGYKYPYYNLYVQKVELDDIKAHVFPQFLGVFLTLLPTQGNILQVLIACIPYTDERIKPRLIELTEKLKTDNNYMHYWEFAEYIGTTEAQMVMSMIHSFSEAGARPEELEELERLIDSLQVNKMNEVIRKKSNIHERYSNYPILLLVGFVLLFAGIVLVQNLSAFTGYMNLGG